MGRFEQIAKQVAALPMDRQDVIAEFVLKRFETDLSHTSLLSEAQNEELRVILTKPIEVASTAEMAAVFENFDGNGA